MIDCSIVKSTTIVGKKSIELSFGGATNVTKKVEWNDNYIGRWRIEFVTNSYSLDFVASGDDKCKVKPSMIDEGGKCIDRSFNEWLERHGVDTKHFQVYIFFCMTGGGKKRERE